MNIAKSSLTGRLFKSSAAAFRSAIERCGIQLPDGQLTHVLRHTFASHFMMNGGNILTLQRILGYSSLAMTMKYAVGEYLVLNIGCQQKKHRKAREYEVLRRFRAFSGFAHL